MYITIKSLWEIHKNKSLIARLTGHDWKTVGIFHVRLPALPAHLKVSWKKKYLPDPESAGKYTAGP